MKFDRRLNRFLRNPGIYIQWIASLIFAATAMTADILGISSTTDRKLLVAAGGLFVFGILNVVVVTGREAYKVRYQRSQRTYSTIHLIAEEARNLRYSPMTAENCLRAINAICFKHLEGVLRDFFGQTPRITLKYWLGNQLHPLRCSNQLGRSKEPEPAAQHEVFNLFVQHMDKFGAINIRDVHDDADLRHIFGVTRDKLRQRAEGKYRSFIAIPLRLSQYTADNLPTKVTVGMLGIDSEKPGSFDDLEGEDLQALYCIVDILTECVINYQQVLAGYLWINQRPQT